MLSDSSTKLSLTQLAGLEPAHATDGYLLQQLQRAIEEKVPDVKKVLAIISDKKFTTICPKIETIELMPLWVNAMCTSNPQLNELLLYIHTYEQQNEKTLPANALQAENIESLIECYRLYFLNKQLVTEQIRNIATEMTSVLTPRENTPEMKAKFTQLKAELQKHSKNDLKYLCKFEFCDLEVTFLEFLIVLRDRVFFSLIDARFTLLFTMIDDQPDEASLFVMEPGNNDKELGAQCRNKFVKIRDESFSQALDVCISDLEKPVSLLGFNKKVLTTAMTKLVTAKGEESFSQYLTAKNTQFNRNYPWWLCTNYFRIVYNPEILNIVLEIINAVKFDDYRLVMQAIYILIIVYNNEKHAVLVSRLEELISRVKPHDLFDYKLQGNNESLFFQMVQWCNPLLMKKILAPVLVKAETDFSDKVIIHEAKSVNPVEYLCLVHANASPDELQGLVQLLIQAGIDPRMAIAEGTIPEKFVKMINDSYQKYKDKVIQLVAGHTSKDVSGIVCSYFFKPVTVTVKPGSSVVLHTFVPLG